MATLQSDFGTKNVGQAPISTIRLPVYLGLVYEKSMKNGSTFIFSFLSLLYVTHFIYLGNILTDLNSSDRSFLLGCGKHIWFEKKNRRKISQVPNDDIGFLLYLLLLLWL
jgi:hypothetical protein